MREISEAQSRYAQTLNRTRTHTHIPPLPTAGITATRFWAPASQHQAK